MIEESYIHENWYKLQTAEWDVMESDGWMFSQPPYVPSTIGITMRKNSTSATFRVDSKLTLTQIHTRLFGFCKTFAKEYSMIMEE